MTSVLSQGKVFNTAMLDPAPFPGEDPSDSQAARRSLDPVVRISENMKFIRSFDDAVHGAYHRHWKWRRSYESSRSNTTRLIFHTLWFFSILSVFCHHFLIVMSFQTHHEEMG